MSLELVNTIGTLLTASIIAATAITAIIQLRHLRAGNQIAAMLQIGQEFVAMRGRTAPDYLEPEAAITTALGLNGHPIVMADPADNRQ